MSSPCWRADSCDCASASPHASAKTAKKISVRVENLPAVVGDVKVCALRLVFIAAPLLVMLHALPQLDLFPKGGQPEVYLLDLKRVRLRVGVCEKILVGRERVRGLAEVVVRGRYEKFCNGQVWPGAADPFVFHNRLLVKL